MVINFVSNELISFQPLAWIIAFVLHFYPTYLLVYQTIVEGCPEKSTPFNWNLGRNSIKGVLFPGHSV